MHLGGLGFTYKWNMGWMHDILQYVHENPIHRRWHHTLVTFSALYMHTENFILPFSHDEVVHGKGAMLDKMPGDVWQKHATLRTLYGYMYGHPGKKLLFMGSEFGQWREWNHDRSLDWHLLDDSRTPGCGATCRISTACTRPSPRCTSATSIPRGFRWMDCNDNENSVRVDRALRPRRRQFLVMVFNFTPVPRERYRIGVPDGGSYAELLNSDAVDLRRRQRRQRRTRPYRGDRRPRLRSVAAADDPAARLPGAETAR